MAVSNRPFILHLSIVYREITIPNQVRTENKMQWFAFDSLLNVFDLFYHSRDDFHVGYSKFNNFMHFFVPFKWFGKMKVIAFEHNAILRDK